MQSTRRFWRSGAALCVGGAVLGAVASGCSASPPPDIEASAVMDPSTMQVSMPVDDYGMSVDQVDLVSQANEVLIDECMAEQGLVNPYASPDYEASPPFPNWRYGLWNEAYVAQFGLGDETEVDPAEQELNDDPAAFSAYITCAADASLVILDSMQVYDGQPPSPLVNASREAYQKTMESEEGKRIVDEWQECVEAKGVRLMGQDSPLSIQLLDGVTDEVQYAQLTAAAKCSDDTDSVAQLFNIEAKFQAQFIASREAEFVAVEKERDAVLEEAQSVLAGR